MYTTGLPEEGLSGSIVTQAAVTSGSQGRSGSTTSTDVVDEKTVDKTLSPIGEGKPPLSISNELDANAYQGHQTGSSVKLPLSQETDISKMKFTGTDIGGKRIEETPTGNKEVDINMDDKKSYLRR